MILKSYANLSYGQTHYRQANQEHDHIIVLLHASPMSSEFMQPLMNELQGEFRVISPDTPGYGASDSLSPEALSAADDLSPYVAWLKEFTDSLKLTKFVLYGSATGAQLAIEFARMYPESLHKVILDNAAHFEAFEREDILTKYFPSLKPQSDGSHFLCAWRMAQGVSQWFPWYQQDEEHRIGDSVMPPALLHRVALAYLIAGESYDQAYRRAFANEDARRVQAVSVPVTVIRWNRSALKKFTDRYDRFHWSNNVHMAFCDGPTENRFRAIRVSAKADL